MTANASILKTNVKRTVRLERELAGGREVRHVVKRFHAPTRPAWIGRLRDRRRARIEFTALSRLAAEGLPVPRPVEVRTRDGCWELVTEYLPDATSLRDLLDGRAPWPAPPGRVAVELGTLLARLHAAGLDHPDLHAGNVLIDGSGAAWLVDLGRARFPRRRPGWYLRDLVALAAGVREDVSPLFRARFLVAYHRAAPADVGSALERFAVEHRRTVSADDGGARAPLAVAALLIEYQARRQRRVAIERRLARWTRESGATLPFERGGTAGFHRRELGPGELDAALDAGASSPDFVVVEDGAREAWLRAARLEMHAIHALRPIVLVTRPRERAVLARPPGSRRLDDAWSDRPERRRVARAVGRLVGSFRDRALGAAAIAPRDVWIAPGAEAFLADPPASFAAEEEPAATWRGLVEEIDDASRTERAAFLTGWLDAQRTSLPERRRLREELVRG